MLVVSPRCLGEGPIVTINDVLAVPANKDIDAFQERHLGLSCPAILKVNFLS